jgi:hypothetical protein
MDIQFSDLVINFDGLEDEELTNNWEWLVPEDYNPILISVFGDIFFIDKADKVHWLSTGEGIMEQVAESEDQFRELLEDEEKLEEWFLPHLVHQLKEAGEILNKEEVFGFTTLPGLEGEFEINNITKVDVLEYVQLAGELLKH